MHPAERNTINLKKKRLRGGETSTTPLHKKFLHKIYTMLKFDTARTIYRTTVTKYRPQQSDIIERLTVVRE